MRWLRFFGIGFNVQPSELAKLFVVLYARRTTLVRKAESTVRGSFRKGFFMPLFGVMLFVGCACC